MKATTTGANRVKKLYLIAEDHLHDVGNFLKQQQQQQSTLGGGRLTPKSTSQIADQQAAAVISSPLSTPLEKEVYILDSFVREVMDGKKKITAPFKLIEYWRNLKRYTRYKKELLEEEAKKLKAGTTE